MATLLYLYAFWLVDNCCIRSIITHGFVLDENNQKMSKSIGNVVSPNDVINGNDKRVSLV